MFCHALLQLTGVEEATAALQVITIWNCALYFALCFVTLPLYSLGVHMAGDFKKHIMPKHLQNRMLSIARNAKVKVSELQSRPEAVNKSADCAEVCPTCWSCIRSVMQLYESASTAGLTIVCLYSQSISTAVFCRHKSGSSKNCVIRRRRQVLQLRSGATSCPRSDRLCRCSQIAPND